MSHDNSESESSTSRDKTIKSNQYQEKKHHEEKEVICKFKCIERESSSRNGLKREG